MNYVAFLRGINVGGKNVTMDAIRQSFEQAGFTDIKTLLASGNILFSSNESDTQKLERLIEEHILSKTGLSVRTLIRSLDSIKQLIKKEPFKDIQVSEKTRRYITFLSDKPQSTFSAPFTLAGGNFTIISITDTEICSVMTISEERKSTYIMAFLEKEFGKNVTTRNWNTILKLIR